jgi:hypothetical protein
VDEPVDDTPAPAPEPVDERPDPPVQRAGLFDAPGAADPDIVRAERPTAAAPEDTTVEDARVAAELEASFADTEPDEAAQDETALEDTEPDDASSDEPDEAPAPSSGAGFFDLPEVEAPEPEPKRRRKGWGRR